MLLSFAGFAMHICRDDIYRNGRKPALIEVIRDHKGNFEILLLRRWLLVGGPE